MPRTPIDYSKSVIYKIQHLEKDELVYVGSTTNFVNRKNKHKSDCKTKQTKVYEMIRENGGWECFNMIIIKEYPCQTRTELEQEEDRVMRELKSSLNMVRPYITTEEKNQYKKEYYEKNKEELKKYRDEYYEKNKEQIKKTNKGYAEKNKEQNLKKQKEYYEKNKEELNKKRSQYYQTRNKEELNKKARENYEKNKEERNKRRRELRKEKKINAIDLKK